jgi:hypothetical protein
MSVATLAKEMKRVLAIETQTFRLRQMHLIAWSLPIEPVKIRWKKAALEYRHEALMDYYVEVVIDTKFGGRVVRNRQTVLELPECVYWKVFSEPDVLVEGICERFADAEVAVGKVVAAARQERR